MGVNSFDFNIKHTELNLLFLSKRVEEILRGDYMQWLSLFHVADTKEAV